MRRKLPPWAMGLAMAPMGFYFGFISTALPILLAGRGVSVGKIAYVSAVAFSPSFWAFLLCPILDVRFTKRTYSLATAAVAALCLGASTLLAGNLPVLTCVVTAGCAAAVIFGNALTGWLPDVIEDKHYAHVGAWVNVANLGAAGAFGTLVVVMARVLSPGLAAAVVVVGAMVPTLLLFYIPVPVRGTRGAFETFRTLFRDLYRVCRRPGCVIGLVCFLSPASCFALTNLFAGMGADFHVNERWVTAIGGTGVAVACSIGCLVSIWLCRRFERRTVYVITGFGGALAAVGLIWMPHTLAGFAVGVLAYNFSQGMNYTSFSALEFEIVGPGNPLAATQMALLTASANLPISYMTAVDGHFYTRFGLHGMLAMDAGASLAMGTILLLIFHRMGANRAAARVPVLEA